MGYKNFSKEILAQNQPTGFTLFCVCLWETLGESLRRLLRHHLILFERQNITIVTSSWRTLSDKFLLTLVSRP